MDNKIKTYLIDVENAIDEINLFFEEGKMKFESYGSNILVQRATERNLEIIGEALNRALKLDGDLQISSLKRIIATRNRIIHGYDSISHEMIWSIGHKSFASSQGRSSIPIEVIY